MRDSAGWQVTFELHAAVGSTQRRRFVDIMMQALEIQDDAVSAQTAQALENNSRVHLSLTHRQFARFFVCRRDAGLACIKGMQWHDAREWWD